MKRCVFALLLAAFLVALLVLPARGSDLAGEVEAAAPEAAQGLSGDDFSGGLSAIWEQVREGFGGLLRQGLSGAVQLLVVLVLCGIGESCHSYRQVAQSFWQARRALQVAEPVGGIAAYRDHLLEIAFGEIPPAVQEAVYRHTFGGCFPQEVREICRFLEIYCRNNGSINRMAQELFIHKNTVQYRITKLHEKLGLDLRNLNDLLQLQFAALIAGRLAGEEPQIPLEGGER